MRWVQQKTNLQFLKQSVENPECDKSPINSEYFLLETADRKLIHSYKLCHQFSVPSNFPKF